MKRRIIKQGNGGNTIFLPIQWIRENNLSAGEEVEVNDMGRELIISTNSKPQKQEITYKLLAKEEPLIRVILNNLYRLGYDKIILLIADKQQEKIIQNVVEHFLLGFDVISISHSKIIIESITEPSGEKQQTILRRMFLTTQESLEMLQQDLVQESYANLRKIEKLTQRFGQYDNFCRRNISKRRFIEQKSHYYWSLYTYLLLIQHAILHLYEELSKNQKFKLDNENETLINLIEYYKRLSSSFFKEDSLGVQEVNTFCTLKLTEIKRKIFSSKGMMSLFFYYCGEIFRLLYLVTAPIQGILLQTTNNEERIAKQG